MTNYEYYVKLRRVAKSEVLELFRRYIERYTSVRITDFQTKALVAFYGFLHEETACEAIQWKKGDIVRVVGQNDISGSIGIVEETGNRDGKTVEIVLEDGRKKTVYGSWLERVEIPPAFMTAARLQLEAEGYAKIKD